MNEQMCTSSRAQTHVYTHTRTHTRAGAGDALSNLGSLRSELQDLPRPFSFTREEEPSLLDTHALPPAASAAAAGGVGGVDAASVLDAAFQQQKQRQQQPITPRLGAFDDGSRWVGKGVCVVVCVCVCVRVRS